MPPAPVLHSPRPCRQCQQLQAPRRLLPSQAWHVRRLPRRVLTGLQCAAVRGLTQHTLDLSSPKRRQHRKRKRQAPSRLQSYASDDVRRVEEGEDEGVEEGEDEEGSETEEFTAPEAALDDADLARNTLQGPPPRLEDEDEEDIAPEVDEGPDTDSEDVLPARRRGGSDVVLGDEDEEEEEATQDQTRPQQPADAPAGFSVGMDDNLEEAMDGLGPAGTVEDEVDLDAILDQGAQQDDLLAMQEGPSAAEDLERYMALQEAAAEREAGYDYEDEYDDDEEADDEPPDWQPARDYPPVPDRSFKIEDLLGMAQVPEAESLPDDPLITGLQNQADRVQPGDLFICIGLPDMPECNDLALELLTAQHYGAVAAIAPKLEAPVEGLEIPLIELEDVEAAQRRLAAAFYDNPSTRMVTIGIAGSHGKTTTSWLMRTMIEQADSLGEPGRPERLVGLLGELEYGVSSDRLTDEGELWRPQEAESSRQCSSPFHVTPWKGIYEPPEPMPDGLRLQKVLAAIADRGADACILEVPSTGIHLGRTESLDLDVAVYLGVQKDDFGEMGVAEHLTAQRRLFESLHDKDRQRAIINVDDPHADDVKSWAIKVPIVTFGIGDRDADVTISKLASNIWETQLEVKTPFGLLEIFTPLIGKGHVHNILATVATGLALGVPLASINFGIESLEFVPGRMQLITEQQKFAVRVDSACTPEQLGRLLDAVKENGARRVLLVMGCEGDVDATSRPYMGEMAHYKADVVFLTNNSPRLESPSSIIYEIAAGYPDELLDENASRYYGPFLQDIGYVDELLRQDHLEACQKYRRWVIEDRFLAIRWAIGTAQPRDVVVIAGKGAQDYQEYADDDGSIVRGWFDDASEAKEALKKLPDLENIVSLDRTEAYWTQQTREARWWEWQSAGRAVA